MALRKVNQKIPSFDMKEMDNIVRDLAVEITAGGDRFDREDLCFVILRAGGDSGCLMDIRDRVMEKARAMLPQEPGSVEFLEKELKYSHSPVSYEGQFLSEQEADFADMLARELHSDFRERKLLEGWVAPGDYKAILYRALPLLNDELRVGRGVLRNTDKGYVYDSRPLGEFDLQDRIAIACNAVHAAGLQSVVVQSDCMKEWDDLGETSRMAFYCKAWDLFKSFKALGYAIDGRRGLLNFRRAPEADRNVLIDKLSCQMHEVKESFECYVFTADHVPFDRLPESSRRDFRSEVETMLRLMDRKGLRPVMWADVSKKAKVSMNISL